MTIPSNSNGKLTKDQEAVLLNGATEAPFSGKYLKTKEKGVYECANCGAKLFSSTRKFDSGSGWPSFDDAISGAITEKQDSSHGMERVEAVCTKCGGHLGHVFNDGPHDTTGVRYCINSLALNFDKEKS